VLEHFRERDTPCNRIPKAMKDVNVHFFMHRSSRRHVANLHIVICRVIVLLSKSKRDSLKIRWVEHMARMGDRKGAYQILVG
jgi:hypothetical protein